MTVSTRKPSDPSMFIHQCGAVCLVAGLSLAHAGVQNIHKSNVIQEAAQKAFGWTRQTSEKTGKKLTKEAVEQLQKELQKAVQDSLENRIQLSLRKDLSATSRTLALLPEGSGGERISATRLEEEEKKSQKTAPRGPTPSVHTRNFHPQASLDQASNASSWVAVSAPARHEVVPRSTNEAETNRSLPAQRPSVADSSSWDTLSLVTAQGAAPKRPAKDNPLSNDFDEVASTTLSDERRAQVFLANAAAVGDPSPLSPKTPVDHQKATYEFFESPQRILHQQKPAEEVCTIISDEAGVPPIEFHIHVNPEPTTNNLQAWQGLAQLAIGVIALCCGFQNATQKR